MPWKTYPPEVAWRPRGSTAVVEVIYGDAGALPHYTRGDQLPQAYS